MRIERHGRLARDVRTLMHLGAVGGWTDGQLLERYVAGGATAEDSFAVLVDRHGPMVLRVCRSILGDGPDAHDAFQATFLVLVRRARSLCVRDSLGPWLYQVAWRVARCSRSDRARRQRHEQRAAELRPATVEGPSMPDRDREAILHEELARLPARYRGPLVLCDLEGHPHELAARHLGCAVGTIKSRLARGREKLRARLTRRGLSPTAGLGAALPIPTAGTRVPAALVDSTLQIAARQAAGGAVPATVAGLAEGALKIMLFAQIRTLAIAGLAASALTTGAAVVARDAAVAGGQDEAKPQAPREQPRAKVGQAGPETTDKDPSVHEVQPGPLRSTIVARAQVRSRNTLEIKSEVEGQTTIISILPEGTRVKKDQLVCTLDSSVIRDNLANQKIDTETAKAEYEGARIAFEAAALGVKEYAEGILPRETRALEDKIELARG